jgi:hypothetical protein
MSTLMWVLIALAVVAIVLFILMAVRRGRGMGLRKLPPEARSRYEDAWRAVEARFIEQPQTAVTQADRIATEMLRERGARMDGRRMPRHLEEARELSRQSGDSSTEGLRRAMLRYRQIVEDGIGEVARRPETPQGRREVAS